MCSLVCLLLAFPPVLVTKLPENYQKILPENITRKSIALYYYSNGRPLEERNSKLTFHSTIYRNRKNSEEKIETWMISNTYPSHICTHTMHTTCAD